MCEKKMLPENPNLAIEIFNPSDYVAEYINSKGEKLKKLPFNAQLMWFRLKYPDGKIAVETRNGNGVIIAKARVYRDYHDPAEAYIAEGESSRGPSPDMPSINPRNWAQTAAIAAALRYAGFGLEFDLSGEEPETVTAEFDALMDKDNKPPVTAQVARKIVNNIVDDNVDASAPAPSLDYSSMSDEDAVAAAGRVICKSQKYSGRSLSDVLAENPSYARYVLGKFNPEDELYKAVKVISDAAKRLSE